jgi:4-amino-4-deoxy-L-arabinose transferase-like glycosyltransferase
VIVRKLEVKNDVFSELKIGYSKNNKMIIGLILGLLVIPLIGFLLRFNNALTLPLFDDELSHGVTAWGLSQGRFVGLNLAGPWDPVTSNLLQTGAYKVEPWPSVLSMPFVGTLIYPSFTLVSPFIEPFMTYLFANPFLQVFGFNEIGIRLPFIIMNILIIMLVYIIASRNGNILAGVLGSLFFALNPYSSHYGSKAFLDNGVGLFFVISFYLFLKYKDKFSNPSATKYLYLSATCAAFSTLSKIGAIFAPAFFLIALLTIRNIKRSSFMKAFVLIIGIISIYPVIGLLTSPEAFLLSMSGFSSYTQKATSVASSGALPVFAHMVLIGATLVGLLCLTYLISIKEKDKIYIILASVVYILILLFAFTYAKEHYFVALLPFLSVAFGITLSNIVSNVKPIEIIIFFSIITFFLTTDSYTFLLLVILIFLNAVYLYMKTYTNKNVNSLNRIIYYFSLFYLFLLFSILIYGAWQYIFQY